jgi:ABC-type transport system substrate-binding protein
MHEKRRKAEAFEKALQLLADAGFEDINVIADGYDIRVFSELVDGDSLTFLLASSQGGRPAVQASDDSPRDLIKATRMPAAWFR